MTFDWFRSLIEVLTPDKYNADWLRLMRWWNDHNSGARTWDNANATNSTITTLTATTGSIGALTSTTSTVLKGTTTNDSAAAGNVGEQITSSVGGTNVTNNVITDLTSITLTAGDWIIFGQVFFHNTTSVNTQAIGAVTTTSGNSFTGATQGDTRMDTFPSPTTAIDVGVNITQRASLASSTIYYLKGFLNYTAGQGQAGGRIFAVRTR